MTAPTPSGFLLANIATAIARDPKVRAAVRAGGWEAFGAYIILVCATWEQGEQVDVADAVGALPRDFPELTPAQLAVLDEAGLTADGAIPDDAFAKHYGTARERATHRSAVNTANGRKGGRPRSDAKPIANRSVTGSRNRSLTETEPTAATDRLTDDATNVASVGLSSDAPAPGKGAARPTPARKPKPIPFAPDDDAPPARPRPSWGNGPRCSDPADHAWTFVMTPSGPFCRTCDPVDDSREARPTSVDPMIAAGGWHNPELGRWETVAEAQARMGGSGGTFAERMERSGYRKPNGAA